jgi:2,4-dienoyl-CoA reductase-like NADH-dependent reductase (Old Yellow Enzyme family)
MLIFYRHTPVGDGYGMEDSLAFARRLVQAGVDVLDISPASDRAPADRAAPFRALGVPVIGVNDMDVVERAAEAVSAGRADLAAIGRGLIADPDWPRKVREGRLDAIIRCTKCDELCFGNLHAGKPIACTQWPDGRMPAA